MSRKTKTTATKKDDKRALVPKLRFPEFRGAAGWSEHRLGDICKLYQAETISSSDFVPNGQHLVYGANGVVGRLDRYNHEFEEVAVSCRGNCGEVHLTRPQSWITGNAMIVAPAIGDLSKEFLYRLLVSADLKPIISGSAQPQITRQGFSPFVVSLPCPLEQQKISACLSSADELIAAQVQKLDALKTHKKGLIQQLFPREGETQPRLRFPEFKNAGDWIEGSMADIGTVLQGYGFPERHQGQKNGDYPFYKVSDISKSLAAGKMFIEDSANYINDSLLKELRAKAIPSGTTVFAKIGEAIRSNKRAITTVPCLIDNNAAGVKRINGKATDEFIYLLLEQISLIDHAGGVVPAVNKSAIESIGIKYPTIEEQRKVAGCLFSLEELVASEIKKLESLKSHKKGQMQQLFPSPDEVKT
jgi:type I restriction enzyme S subunit